MEWLYRNKKVNSIENIPKDTFGFVYEIEHIPSKVKYIGKKQLWSKRRVKIGKRELAKIKLERKEKGVKGRHPVKKEVIKESDWQKYYGSNRFLKRLAKEEPPTNFKRKILEYCPNKTNLTYREVWHMFRNDVLGSNKYFNEDILGKFFSTKDFRTNPYLGKIIQKDIEEYKRELALAMERHKKRRGK